MKKLRDPPTIRQAEAERGPVLCAPHTPHVQNNGDESLALPRMHALVMRCDGEPSRVEVERTQALVHSLQLYMSVQSLEAPDTHVLRGGAAPVSGGSAPVPSRECCAREFCCKKRFFFAPEGEHCVTAPMGATASEEAVARDLLPRLIFEGRPSKRSPRLSASPSFFFFACGEGGREFVLFVEGRSVHSQTS